MSDQTIFICPVCEAVIEGDQPCPNGPHADVRLEPTEPNRTPDTDEFVAVENPPTSGMFPDEPMERCEDCERWSYLAAITGRCLSCATDKEQNPDA